MSGSDDTHYTRRSGVTWYWLDKAGYRRKVNLGAHAGHGKDTVMKSTVDLAPPRRERREAFLKARWKEELVARFEQIAREHGQTGAEVLRFLALGYIADKRQN